MKTASEIEGDFWTWVKGSPLATAVNGNVYRGRGMRPRDSRLEDITVCHIAGLTGQVQEGVVRVKVYVKDIDPWDNGVMVADGARLSQIERIAQDWFDCAPEVGSDYWLELQDTIATGEDAEISQHFVVISIKYNVKF